MWGTPVIIAGVVLATQCEGDSVKNWSYRDDVGSHWGIKGYEEMVTEVGTHHGHISWPQHRFLGTYDSGSVRRGFQVFAKNCANCHGAIYKKYDILLDKAYKQLELASMVTMFSINPGHHHFKQYYYQEWTDRDRYIHDHIYPTYMSQDEAKNANGGVWPTDFSKIHKRPGGVNYIYNILTGYNFKAPYGIDIPKGKSFNPYFDHMIIGMPKQLVDGLIDYEDGTPSSSPQMASDVSSFISFIQRRHGYARPEFMVKYYMVLTGVVLLSPFMYLKTRGYFRNLLAVRWEMYAVRDAAYYKHFKEGGMNSRASQYRSNFWV